MKPDAGRFMNTLFQNKQAMNKNETKEKDPFFSTRWPLKYLGILKGADTMA